VCDMCDGCVTNLSALLGVQDHDCRADSVKITDLGLSDVSDVLCDEAGVRG
jgi:hypothetical protein